MTHHLCFVSTARRGFVEGYVASAEKGLFEEKKRKKSRTIFTQWTATANTASIVPCILMSHLARSSWLFLGLGCVRTGQGADRHRRSMPALNREMDCCAVKEPDSGPSPPCKTPGALAASKSRAKGSLMPGTVEAHN
jgi:hypothetical protein